MNEMTKVRKTSNAKNSTKATMKSVELFVGAGGLAIGVSRAGFHPEAVVEWDHDACEAIRENKKRGVYPMAKWPLHEMDVKDFVYSDVKSQIDLLAGGPPCQPFSLGGKHRGNKDSRDMFPQVVRAVRELKPRAILIENVKGLTRATFKEYFNYIQLQLKNPEVFQKESENWLEHCARLERSDKSDSQSGLRYTLSVRVLNAANYGVPQKRERVFFVGFKSGSDIVWDFPKPTHSLDALLWDKWISNEYWDRHHISKTERPDIPANLATRIIQLKAAGKPNTKPWVTVRDAIADLPTPTTLENAKFYNHKLVKGAKRYPGHTGCLLDMPAKTIKAGTHGVPGGENMVVLDNGNVRYFTVRESARLQTFPDNYRFPMSCSESMRQLGNAVPVTLGYAVANEIKNSLKKCPN